MTNVRNFKISSPDRRKASHRVRWSWAVLAVILVAGTALWTNATLILFFVLDLFGVPIG